MLSVSRVVGRLCRKMSSATSYGAKILFTDTGAIGDGSVALTMGAPAERHLVKVSSIMDEASTNTKVCIPYLMELQLSRNYNCPFFLHPYPLLPVSVIP